MYLLISAGWLSIIHSIQSSLYSSLYLLLCISLITKDAWFGCVSARCHLQRFRGSGSADWAQGSDHLLHPPQWDSTKSPLHCITKEAHSSKMFSIILPAPKVPYSSAGAIQDVWVYTRHPSNVICNSTLKLATTVLANETQHNLSISVSQ